MPLTIHDPELERKVNESVARGEFASPDELLRHAVELLFDESATELEETRAAVNEAYEQAERGEGISAEEVFTGMWSKLGLS